MTHRRVTGCDQERPVDVRFRQAEAEPRRSDADDGEFAVADREASPSPSASPPNLRCQNAWPRREPPPPRPSLLGVNIRPHKRADGKRVEQLRGGLSLRGVVDRGLHRRQIGGGLEGRHRLAEHARVVVPERPE